MNPYKLQTAKPVNRQAAQSLSRGTGKIETVEGAIEAMKNVIAGPDHIDAIRKRLEMGVTTEYRLRIYKRRDGLPGFKVSLKCWQVLKITDVCQFGDLL